MLVQIHGKFLFWVVFWVQKFGWTHPICTKTTNTHIFVQDFWIPVLNPFSPRIYTNTCFFIPKSGRCDLFQNMASPGKSLERSASRWRPRRSGFGKHSDTPWWSGSGSSGMYLPTKRINEERLVEPLNPQNHRVENIELLIEKGKHPGLIAKESRSYWRVCRAC